MDLRRLAGVLLALIVCFGMLPAGANAASFSDVPKNHWAYDAIMAAESRGLIQGSGGKFRPGDSISSQAFLSVFCRAWGLDDRKLETGDRWAEPAMAFGQYAGWFEEEELTRTSRTEPITREFAAKLPRGPCLSPGQVESHGGCRCTIGWLQGFRHHQRRRGEYHPGRSRFPAPDGPDRHGLPERKRPAGAGTVRLFRIRGSGSAPSFFLSGIFKPRKMWYIKNMFEKISALLAEVKMEG